MLTAILFALQTAPAAAPPQPYRAAPATVVAEPVALLLAGFDRDRDARITRAELREGLEDIGKAVGNWPIGYIAFADWALRWLGDRNAAPTPFEVDRDGDNRITFDELANRVTAIFDRYDTDRDGVLTRTELLTVRATPYGSDRPDGEDGRGRRKRR